MEARAIEKVVSGAVNQELASVLWNQGEQTVAIDLLKDVVAKENQSTAERSLLLARLVSIFSLSCYLSQAHWFS